MQAHRVHTGCVQVVRQPCRRLHLHVGLEDAGAEQCLVVGLPRLGLDSVFIRLSVTLAEMVREIGCLALPASITIQTYMHT
jgi:hypothetical protein